MKEYMRIIDIDMPWDNTDPNENFGTMLQKLRKVAPSSFVQVWKYEGSGGGWPQGEIIVLREEARAVLEFFGHDEEDQEWWLSDMVPLGYLVVPA